MDGHLRCLPMDMLLQPPLQFEPIRVTPMQATMCLSMMITMMIARTFPHWPELLMEKMKTYGCVERVTVRTGELALVMDGHACDVAMIPSMMPSPPQTFATRTGSWMFVPNAPPSNAGSRRNHDDPDDASLQEAYAESETVTTDPSVEPVTLSPMNMSRRQRRALKRRNPGNPKVARGHNVLRVPKCLLTLKLIKIPKYSKILKYAIVSQFLTLNWLS